MSYSYKYPRPALTVDCVIFGLDDRGLKVLLIQRARPPFQNCWALPGGFAEVGESLDDSAKRELEEETGLTGIVPEQLHTFSNPERDPREHVITTAYLALVNLAEHRVQAADDAKNAAWFPLGELPELAFDHDQILDLAHARLRDKIARQPIGRDLLPETFPLERLQRIYEMILDRPLDSSDFLSRILELEILKQLDETSADAGQLYRFNKQGYDCGLRRGFHLEL